MWYIIPPVEDFLLPFPLCIKMYQNSRERLAVDCHLKLKHQILKYWLVVTFTL